jgi:hypothetical protein
MTFLEQQELYQRRMRDVLSEPAEIDAAPRRSKTSTSCGRCCQACQARRPPTRTPNSRARQPRPSAKTNPIPPPTILRKPRASLTIQPQRVPAP